MLLTIKKPKKVQIYISKGQHTAAQVKSLTGADVVINGGLYQRSTMQPVCHLRADGVNYATDAYNYWGYGWDTGTAALKPMVSNNKNSVDNYICCSCMILNGKAEKMIYASDTGGSRGNTAIGRLADGSIVVDVHADTTGSRITPEALQTEMLNYGCVDAVRLDGGGSSQLASNEGNVTSSRCVHNYICIWNGENGGEGTTASNIEKILTVAKAEVGVKESPAGSNNVKYNTERYGGAVYGSGYAWCATFVWWVFKHAGLSSLYYGGGKCDYCPTLVNYYRSKGQTVSKPTIGALALYDWDKDGVADHIGIVESVSGNTFVAIEGNTAVGNDSNGGQVMRRSRTASQVLCFAWPYGTTDTNTGGTKVTITVDLLKKGSKGSIVKALQTLLGLRGYACGYIDGDFGAKTDAAVRAFQKAKKLEVDGIVGAATWTALLTA